MDHKIKTFGDACAALSLDPLAPENASKYSRLPIVIEALNEGWKPDWNNDDEYKYFPWFDMQISDDNPTGFQMYYVFYGYTFSDVSSRLCFRSRDLAKYAVSQFEDIYKEYFTF